MPTPDLSIVIVSWNVKDLLEKCLQSIFKFQNDLNLEVIVIDNASADQTATMVKKEFPNVKLIANNINVGFAQANNQGIMASAGDLILVLNPDTEIIKNALARMVNFIQSNSKIGIVGAKHLNPDYTLQPSVRRFPSFWPIFFIFTKLAKIFPNLPPVYSYLARDFDYKITQPVDQVAGSCLLIRKVVLDQIGLFDENFFTWFEEVDLCKRTKDGGWQIWFLAEAEILHAGGQSFNQLTTFKKQNIFFQSAFYYFKKHGLRKTPKP